MTDDVRERRDSTGWVWLQVVLGVGLVFVLHLCVAALLGGVNLAADAVGLSDVRDMAAMLGMGWFLAIGLSQAFYTVPAFFLALLIRRRSVAAGIAIGAGVTFLLNGACYGVFCGALAGGY